MRKRTIGRCAGGVGLNPTRIQANADAQRPTVASKASETRIVKKVFMRKRARAAGSPRKYRNRETVLPSFPRCDALAEPWLRERDLPAALDLADGLFED